VGQVELDESRRKVVGNYLLERETNSGKAFHLALSESAGVGFEFEAAFLKEVESVTPAEVLEVAKKYLDNCTLIVARPPGRIYWDL
jgi:predicted Zn-dependent peptidase